MFTDAQSLVSNAVAEPCIGRAWAFRTWARSRSKASRNRCACTRCS